MNGVEDLQKALDKFPKVDRFDDTNWAFDMKVYQWLEDFKGKFSAFKQDYDSQVHFDKSQVHFDRKNPIVYRKERRDSDKR
jgi:hypothetical protein